MTNKEKVFKMLGFPVVMAIAPAVEVTTAKTKKATKPKAVKDEK